MGRENIKWGIAGFVFSPISQVMFRFSHGENLSQQDNRAFKLYYLSFVLFIVFVLSVVLLSSSTVTTTASKDYQATAHREITNLEPSKEWVPSHEDKRKIAEDNYQEHLQIIYASHPNAAALVSSTQFASWLQSLEPSQYSEFNRIKSQGNAREVIDMLNAFKDFQREQDYKSHREYIEVTDKKTSDSLYTLQDIKLPTRTAEQQKEANKKTMSVFIDAEALDKKRTLVKQGYTEQLAEDYVTEWKQQKINRFQ